jgi:hypothetical protein
MKEICWPSQNLSIASINRMDENSSKRLGRPEGHELFSIENNRE